MYTTLAPPHHTLILLKPIHQLKLQRSIAAAITSCDPENAVIRILKSTIRHRRPQETRMAHDSYDFLRTVMQRLQTGLRTFEDFLLIERV